MVIFLDFAGISRENAPVAAELPESVRLHGLPGITATICLQENQPRQELTTSSERHSLQNGASDAGGGNMKNENIDISSKRLSFKFGLIGMLVLTGVCAEANLITNGGFEDGVFTPGAGTPGEMLLNGGSTAMQGWIAVGGAALTLGSSGQWQIHPTGIAWESNDNGMGFQTPFGTHFLNLALDDGSSHLGGITLAQGITTIPGQRYRLSFAIGSSSSIGDMVDPAVKVTVNGMPAASAFYADLGADWPDTSGSSHWEMRDLDFTATGSSTFITFNADLPLVKNGRFIGLDNVSLVAVPESGIGWMGCGTLVCLVMLKRFGSKQCKQ